MTNSTQLKQYQQAQEKMIIILTIMDMAIFMLYWAISLK